MASTTQQYIARIHEVYANRANEFHATPMKRYMRDQFLFYGLQSPLRKELSRDIIRELGRPQGDALKALCRACFASEYREVQYFVQDLVRPVVKKLDPTFLSLWEALIQQKSWWDSVDFLAPKLAGAMLLKYPDQIAQYPDRWIESDNFWLQRSALLFQLDYKHHTDAEKLFRYILRRADSGEFFVQKAAGWALRNYSKVNSQAVTTFVENHDLPKLTRREGLKWLNKHTI
jgi:3-methyladenine DNA glycosylase AlkD